LDAIKKLAPFLHIHTILSRENLAEYPFELLYHDSSFGSSYQSLAREEIRDKLPFFGGEVVKENTTSRASLELAVRNIHAFTILKLATPLRYPSTDARCFYLLDCAFLDLRPSDAPRIASTLRSFSRFVLSREFFFDKMKKRLRKRTFRDKRLVECSVKRYRLNVTDIESTI